MTLSKLPLSRHVSVSSFLCRILVHFATFLGLRFCPPLMVSLYSKNGIFRIFLIVPLLLMSVLLRLPWSSIFLYVHLMVILSQIRLVIDILSGVLSIWQLHAQIFLILSIF